MGIGIVSEQEFEQLKAQYRSTVCYDAGYPIDLKMRELVKNINRLPGVVSTSCCQGHSSEERGGRLACGPYLSIAVTQEGAEHLDIFDRTVKAFYKAGYKKHGVSISLRYLYHVNPDDGRYPVWTIKSDSGIVSDKTRRECNMFIALLGHEIQHAVVSNEGKIK